MVPKRYEIAQTIRDQIVDGDYAPGSHLPPLRDLMTQFGAARETVRAAIAQLSHEGLVTPLPGVGTVVRDTTPVPLSYKPGAGSQVWAAQTGENDGDRLINAWAEPADPEIAERLELPDGTFVVHRLRHQRKGRQLAQIHDQWIPGLVALEIQEAVEVDLADANATVPTDMFSMMRQADQPPATVTETITARMPVPDEVDDLQTPPGVPVIVTYRITRNAGGAPLETSTFVAAADRVMISYTVPVEEEQD
jgi:GntR family transcriptional regulator